ncbi:hypothetical protein K0M31_001103 [Melipona bicolor]|uniref:DUF4708 domain-containing protein n=1 Tax=Melipona bicolor TaxID=60889 RepID=A0AA40GEU7_9HYME|nr:hypothetical protein K0M31_001103 [Melipona bicolor]
MDACNLMYERKEQSVLYASFPHINDLRCAICKIDFIEVHDSSAKSYFHWQTLKCRLLIHLISDVIASPILGTERCIFVIGYKKFFEAGKLERILKNFKLVYQGLRSVTMELYKNCLIYTIQTKISPLWNKVGDYFVQGKNFYNFVEGIRGLKLDILMKENNMCLQLHAQIVKIPYITLEDYLPPHIISHFLADSKGYIDLSHYKLPFVHVLPSIKKGKLLSVSKELPANCVFKDYEQLRRHWKNMYGYSLPKNKDGILYYEIKFLIPKSKVFTYPHMCIIKNPLEIILSRDKKSTITYFLSDMLVKLPIICGKQLQISKNTPFNTTSSSTHVSFNVAKDKGLDRCLKEKSNIVSQLEFSDKNVDGLTKDTNTATLAKAQLTRIHQIHNVRFDENIRTKLSNKDMEDVQYLNASENSSTKDIRNNFIEGNISRNSDNNFIASERETISTYFKIQKTNSYVKTKELTQEEEQKQKHLTLKEKLLKAKSSEDSSIFLSGQNISVEAMAKMNKLDQMKNSELSDWLKKHSIPHNSNGRKTELINKILSHIKNTQILQQFRI